MWRSKSLSKISNEMNFLSFFSQFEAKNAGIVVLFQDFLTLETRFLGNG
jgi:hypothetical protein